MKYLEGFLQGQFLVAAPGIQDERFEKSIIYIFSHNKEGAAGLILNRPSEYIDFLELCEQLNVSPAIDCQEHILFEGGPVENNRGYVLHSNEFSGRDTTNIDGTDLSITTTVDVIKRIAEGTGPEKAVVCLGYAGWEAGQLEKEMRSHGWLHADANMDIIFDTPYAKKWESAIDTIGINLGRLAEYSGRA